MFRARMKKWDVCEIAYRPLLIFAIYDYFRENILQMDIYFNELKQQFIQESIVYSVSDLLGKAFMYFLYLSSKHRRFYEIIVHNLVKLLKQT